MLLVAASYGSGLASLSMAPKKPYGCEYRKNPNRDPVTGCMDHVRNVFQLISDQVPDRDYQ